MLLFCSLHVLILYRELVVVSSMAVRLHGVVSEILFPLPRPRPMIDPSLDSAWNSDLELRADTYSYGVNSSVLLTIAILKVHVDLM